jgi:hypothetical protein
MSEEIAVAVGMEEGMLNYSVPLLDLLSPPHNLSSLLYNLTTAPPDPEPAGNENAPCGVFFFVVYGPLFGLVCLLGLVGNSLSFAVLHKYSRNNVATYLLKALAVSDNLFLVTASCVQMYQAMCMYFGLIEHFTPVYPYLQIYVWPFTHIVQMGTVYMMVLVAANRYIAVCLPLQAPRLCSKRNVQLQILFMTIAIVVYNIPRFFEYRVVHENVTLGDNTTEIQPHNEGLASIHLYNILYENVAYCIFVFLLPLVILIFFNVHLVRDLKKAQRSRKTMTSRSSMEENNITLVMIVIIITFIVAQTPASLNQILYYIIRPPPDGECSDYQKYYHISNLLITMNSALNFVIYCLFRRQFQQELVALMCRHRSGTSNRSMRRTIVLRALHDNSFRSSSGGSKFGGSGRAGNGANRPFRHCAHQAMHATTAAAVVAAGAAGLMENVPLRQPAGEDTEDDALVGESPETTVTHLSQYGNGTK